jgi:hypothetical protein
MGVNFLLNSTGSFPQILWSLQRSYLLIQPFFGPHAVWHVSYQLLSRSWHTDLDYGSYRLSNVEIRLTAGVTGQQRMLTPPWHLIPLGVTRGPCKPDFYCGLLYYLNWTRILTANFSVYLTSRTNFDSGFSDWDKHAPCAGVTLNKKWHINIDQLCAIKTHYN